MTKQHLLIVGAAVLAIVWWRGTHKVDAAQQLRDTEPLAGGDFIGDTWARLNGADLIAQGYPNLVAGAQADPGAVGRLGLHLAPSWNGTLH